RHQRRRGHDHAARPADAHRRRPLTPARARASAALRRVWYAAILTSTVFDSRNDSPDTSRTLAARTPIFDRARNGRVEIRRSGCAARSPARGQTLGPSPRYDPPRRAVPAQRHRKGRTGLVDPLAAHGERHARGDYDVRAIASDVDVARLAEVYRV